MNIFLIDGNSYIYRAFYAIRELTNSRGEPTNATFGFTNMLLKILREKIPDGIIIAMDSPEPTKRHDAYEHYKAQRPETPDLLVRQIPAIRKIIDAFRIPVIEQPGYEADDLLAAAARELSNDPANEVFIVTADKDMLQIVHDRIKVFDPMKDIIIDRETVKEKFGLPPERIPELMALTGDAIDNIPGVKGIGDKTAMAILRNVGNLAELLEHPERAGTERLANLIRENRDSILLSYDLAKLMEDAPVDVGEEKWSAKEPDWKALLALFREFEFSSLLKYIPDFKAEEIETTIVTSLPALEELVSTINCSFALKIELTDRNPVFGIIAGIVLCSGEKRGYYIPVHHTVITDIPQIPLDEVLRILRRLLEDETIPKIGHNIKNDIISLRKLGIALKGTLYDTMVASHLLNPNKSNHSIEEAVLAHLEVKRKDFKDVFGKKENIAEADIQTAAQYAGEDAVYPFRMKDILFQRLGKENLDNVYFTIEMPLIRVLADIEPAGVKIDRDKLNRFSKEIERELGSIQRTIYALAGREFNINSPKQLAEVLFHEIGLTPVKKTKTSYSTDTSVLEELSNVHELPRETLNYRSLSKLKNTYIDVLPGLIHPETGRLHTAFNQTVTATGRLSSSDPNLQNIPIRGEWGRKIRDAFIAEEGNLLVSADYSQIELRVLAHLSGDERLIEAFRNNVDIHSTTAAEIFSVEPSAVNPEMRRIAKTVNFGIIYGITPFGLSETLKCSPEEARKYIDRYFSLHQGVKSFIEETLVSVRNRGFSQTLFGRKRPIPDITNRNASQRSQAERMAMNSPIQGTAADIIKIAMIQVANRFTSESISATMILQVHDELLVECEKDAVDRTQAVLKDSMEKAAQLRVPLKVEMGHGRTWAEAHV